MPDLPTGTVTFFFTDIEGSTQLLEHLGDAYADVLAEQRGVVRKALARNGGVEVDTQGDGFFAVFASARGAVAAAAEVQRALAGAPPSVRIGLHTGEAAVGVTGYVGMDVHRAARICAAAHGGQVLLSQATRELVDADVRDLGEHRLKDLTAPQRLYQLLGRGMPEAFPPPRSLDAARTKLPVQLTPLVGRERELRETQALLTRDGVRLLTLTGPAGAGKTRLAVQLAAEVVDEFADGVYVVDLSALRDAGLVVPAIAQSVGVRETPGRPVAEAIAAYLADKRLLLVVDNVEQVLASGPHLGRLLGSCRGVAVVATSREPLRLAGEQEYPVNPLSVEAAVELFVERARAVRPGFALEGNREAVAAICTQLDGLPLAIELAAARVKLLPPTKLLERLDRRLQLLTGGTRDAPARQQTLRAAIDWSFGLLQDDEQELFVRLAVFAGGFTLEAAEAVCEATVDGLASLVDKSLLAVRDTVSGEPRFALLETVREYARDRLDDRGEDAAMAERHAAHYLGVVWEAAVARRSHASIDELAVRLEDDYDNLRAAVAWFRTLGDTDRELRLATGAYWALWRGSHPGELHGWLSNVLERAADVDPGVRAEALAAAGLAATLAGDARAARASARELLSLAHERDDKQNVEWALRVLSFDEENLDERLRLLEECERLVLELGDEVGLAWVTVQLGWLWIEAERLDEARSRFTEGSERFDRLGRPWEAANARIGTCFALLLEDRLEEATQLAEGCLRTMVELGSTISIARCLEVLARCHVDADAPLAARLTAAAAQIRTAEGQPGDRVDLVLAEQMRKKLREQLGEERLPAEWDAGGALTPDEAAALVLAAR